MADSTVKVNFIGDSSSLKNAVDDADGHIGRLGSSIGNFAKVAAVGFGAAAVGLGVFAKGAIDAARESEKVTASTEAVIKSTGAAAHVTAKQVAELATAISNKTGIDDEAIQSGQNLLLTFTNLQNRAGKGNDIFNQATSIMVDMAAALGTDASGAAIQLGKALNDPVKGITALTRVGVSFTAQQKEQIKAMQAAGNIAGAQKIILAELNTEFGGMAAAQATATMKMKVAFGNLQEQIGGMLIPIVEKLSTFLAEKVIPAMSRLADKVAPKLQAAFSALFGWIQAHVPPAFHAVVDGIQSIIAKQGFQEFLQNMVTAFEAVRDVVEQKVLPALQSLGAFLIDDVLPAIRAVWEFLFDHKEILVGVAVAIGVGLVSAMVTWTAATYAQAVAYWALNGAMIIANIQFYAILAVIALLVAGVIYAYKHWGWFKTAVDAVADAAVWLWEHVLQPFAGWLANNFVTILETVGRVALAAMTGGMSEAAIFIYHHWDDIIAFFKGLPDKIWDALSGVAEAIMHPFKVAFDWIQNAWDNSIGRIFNALNVGGGPSTATGATNFGNGPGGSTVYGGGRAAGGSVNAGMAYTVGEHGPETLIMGSGSGRVVPNGGGLTVIVQGNVYGERDLFGMINKGLRNGLTIG